jgi:ribonuclease-3
MMEALGYRFEDETLLVNALTHGSHHNEHPDMPSNERLEFLGDAVLGFVVSEDLYRRGPDLDEGHLTSHKAMVVGEAFLAIVARRIRLDRHVLLGHGEARNEDVRDSILADALEAVIAAVYLDGGMDAAVDLVVRLMGTALAGEEDCLPRDHKSELQVRVLSSSGCLPRYHLLEESGPDHYKRFVFEVCVPGGPSATGTGRSKKSAQQDAAAGLLRVLRRDEEEGGEEEA